MWVRARLMTDANRSCSIDQLSKLTTIKELRDRIRDELAKEIDASRVRLFFAGKELVDNYSLFDYKVDRNDLIQVTLRPAPKTISDDDNNNDDKVEDANSVGLKNDAEEKTEPEVEEKDISLATYRKDEVVDVLDTTTGAWFEGEIQSIKGVPVSSSSSSSSSATSSATASSATASSSSTPSPPTYSDDGYSYTIKFENYDEVEIVCSARLRPVSRKTVDMKDVKAETTYLVNANLESPEERGFWYDFSVQPSATASKKKRGPSTKELEGWIFAGSERIPVETKLVVKEKVFQLEKVGEAKRIFRDGRDGSPPAPEARPVGPECSECKGSAKRKCKTCGCAKCGGKEEPERTIICDECEDGYHMKCLVPKMEEMPTDDYWYCPNCARDDNEIVKAGEGLKASKKKANMPSAKGGTKRDWGKGMATQGVKKMCTVVGPDHFGPIPGVEVGTSWLFRVEACGSGVHRPPVAGIAGKASMGSPSIVLSGGYEDDLDEGETFTYTGAGGRDLSGNKRTAEQSCDQELTKTNKALAMNCAAKFSEKGADAGDKWKEGKPLRVVRNYKGAKHSKYAPKQGNRYDGIYKVVRYWFETGKSGFKVWKYEMRRDDPAPAPWTSAGKKWMLEQGIPPMIVPEGYYEQLKEKEEKVRLEKEEKAKAKRKSKVGSEGEGEDDSEENEDANKKKKKSSSKTSAAAAEAANKDSKRKRKISSSDEEEEEEDEDEDDEGEKENRQTSKRARKSSVSENRVVAYVPPKDISDCISNDNLNDKLWAEVKETSVKGKPAFLEKLKDAFLCVCCQDVVVEPVTTPCRHNSCQDCLKRSFKSGVNSCPVCRGELTEADVKNVNQNLAKVLKTLLPGYGR